MEFRKLRANEIECRVATVKSNGVSLLLYKDARADMNLLDETVGSANWQRNHELINGNLFCNVGIKVDGEWVWKQDVGTESYTEKEKGQASDSFKRACFNWGLGRELYTAPFIWIKSGDVNIKDNKTYDRFSVKEIAYTDGVITTLVIKNDTSGKIVFSMGTAEEVEAEKHYEEVRKQTINATKVKILKGKAEESKIDVTFVAGLYGHKTLEEATEAEFNYYINHWKEVEERWSAKEK